MQIGLTMECDYREGMSQEQAFDDAFYMVEVSEELGLDGVWLAERHFAHPHAEEAGIPSVAAAPLIFATAIAARTSRLRVGTAVLVLPLGHPVRMAEEVATLDQISRGRLDLGIGRSSFPRAYQGYDISYGESRERFHEYLEVMRLAWTEEWFSYEGDYFSFQDVRLIPKPRQKPHPPLRVAVTSRDNFPQIGALGLPIFVGLRSMNALELAQALETYRTAWREAGHPGGGDVMLRVPVYVASDMERALSEPETSTVGSYSRERRAYIKSNVGAFAESAEHEERTDRAGRLADVTYEELLETRLAYGSPEVVASRLAELREELGLSGIIIEPNVGGRTPQPQVLDSLRLFATEVAPRLR